MINDLEQALSGIPHRRTRAEDLLRRAIGGAIAVAMASNSKWGVNAEDFVNYIAQSHAAGCLHCCVDQYGRPCAYLIDSRANVDERGTPRSFELQCTGGVRFLFDQCFADIDRSLVLNWWAIKSDPKRVLYRSTKNRGRFKVINGERFLHAISKDLVMRYGRCDLPVNALSERDKIGLLERVSELGLVIESLHYLGRLNRSCVVELSLEIEAHLESGLIITKRTEDSNAVLFRSKQFDDQNDNWGKISSFPSASTAEGLNNPIEAMFGNDMDISLLLCDTMTKYQLDYLVVRNSPDNRKHLDYLSTLGWIIVQDIDAYILSRAESEQ